MGCDRIRVLGRCLVGSTRDEESLVPRNRHHVPASHPGSPVETHCDRYQRRRVVNAVRGSWGEFMRCVKVGRFLRASREVHGVRRAKRFAVDLNPCATELFTALSHTVLRSITKLCTSASFVLCGSQCWNGAQCVGYDVRNAVPCPNHILSSHRESSRLQDVAGLHNASIAVMCRSPKQMPLLTVPIYGSLFIVWICSSRI